MVEESTSPKDYEKVGDKGRYSAEDLETAVLVEQQEDVRDDCEEQNGFLERDETDHSLKIVRVSSGIYDHYKRRNGIRMGLAMLAMVVFMAMMGIHARKPKGEVLVSSPMEAPSGECSCFNTHATEECCDRSVLSQHKFGDLLARNMFRSMEEIYGVQKRYINGPGRLPPLYVNGNVQDYRYIIIGRNIFASLVAGFQYHRAGHECGIAFNGERRSDFDDPSFDWYAKLSPQGKTGLAPPREGRTICEYLVDESEEVGLRVYMRYALANFYHGIKPLFQNIEERQKSTQLVREMVICEEDMANSTNAKQVFDQVNDFLFPGGLQYKIPLHMPRPKNYHWTPQSDVDSKRFLGIVERLDSLEFNNEFAEIESIVKCGDRNQKISW